jgi:hypothetical protein
VGEEGIEPPSFPSGNTHFRNSRSNFVATAVAAVDSNAKRSRSLTGESIGVRELDMVNDPEIDAFRAAWEGLEPSLRDALGRAAREPKYIQAALSHVMSAVIDAARARLD